MKTQETAKKYHVPALEKGLDILEALAAIPTPQSLSELARQLSRSTSELFRMLNCLENRDYIIKDERSGTYALSLKLYELAHTHSPVEHLMNAATRPMRELSEAVQESCHLGVLRHGKLLILAQAESPRKIRLSVEVGALFPFIHTASGRLLMAYLPPDDLERLLVADPDYRKMKTSEQDAFHTQLEEVRRTGYSVATNESYVGVQDFSVLVGNPSVGLIAALAIASLTDTRAQDERKNLVAALQACAATITRAMGITTLSRDDKW